MLDINLLPEELRPRPRSPLPYLMTAVLALAVVLYCLISCVGKWRTISSFNERIAELDIRIEEVKDSAEAVKELERETREVNAKQIAIDSIMSDRILWSKVLHMLAGLVPDDVWLSDLRETVDTTKITVDNPDPQASQPKITKTITVRKLKVAGYAMSPREESGVHLVGRFVSAMEDENNPDFSPEFAAIFRDPEPQSIDDEDFEGTAVKKFEIWCDIVGRGTL